MYNSQLLTDKPQFASDKALYGGNSTLSKMLDQLLHGTCAVRVVVLDIHAKLCERLVVALRHKDRVVAESLGALLLLGYSSFNDTLKQRIVAAVSLSGKTDDGAELRAAVVHTLKSVQQFLHVSLRVVVGTLGITCRMYTRLASKRRHLKTRVVGKAVVAIVVDDVACLLYGVALKCVGCLGYVDVASNVVKRQYLEARAEDRAYLLKLVLVVGGED